MVMVVTRCASAGSGGTLHAGSGVAARTAGSRLSLRKGFGEVIARADHAAARAVEHAVACDDSIITGMAWKRGLFLISEQVW